MPHNKVYVLTIYLCVVDNQGRMNVYSVLFKSKVVLLKSQSLGGI